MIKLSLILFLLCAALTTNSYAQDPNTEKAKVKAVIDGFAKFWETENMNLLSKIMAHDSDMVNYGTGADEVFIGWNALKDYVQKTLPAIENTKITVRDQVIKIDNNVSTAWFAEIWDWDLTFGGQQAKLPDQRFTGVLVKRDGNWVIVQFHNSVPVTH